MRPYLPLILLLSGCAEWPDSVGLFGVVTDAPYDEGEVLEGMTVTTLDQTLNVVSEATTGADGSFYADVASAQSLFVEVSGEGYLTTHFGGSVGVVDMEVGSGVFFTLLEEDLGLLVDDFGDCVSDDDTTATIVGEARLYLMGIAASDLPEDPNVSVSAYDPDGNNFPACYLDEDGVYDADAEFTGDTGRFGIFGAPAGPLAIEMVSWIQDTSESDPEPYGVYYYFRDVSEGGVAPLYPALTEN